VRELQLATLVATPPEGDDWLHETKFDGYRILAERRGDTVTLWSRNGKRWTDQFPTIAAALARLPAQRFAIDGEVAAVLPDGRTSFQALQGSFAGGGAQLAYFVFDLLELGDDDLAALPLEQRKAKLAELVARAPREIRYSEHVVGRGAACFREACKLGLEGIVSKRRDRPYAPGRGRDWLKIKCILRQELVIGGFTEPAGARTGIGALLVGYYDGAALRYAGKVGTGFTAKLLGELRAELDPLEVATAPFTPLPARAATGPRVHWVKPKLVAEIAFSEWTADGRLRHPSFQGMRRDKPARAVVRERAK